MDSSLAQGYLHEKWMEWTQLAFKPGSPISRSKLLFITPQHTTFSKEINFPKLTELNSTFSKETYSTCGQILYKSALNLSIW